MPRYYDDELYHSFGGWKKHKYIKKVKIKKGKNVGKWRYIYKEAKKAVSNALDKIGDAVEDVAEDIGLKEKPKGPDPNRPVSKPTAPRQVPKMKFGEERYQEARRQHKYVKRIKTAKGYRYFYSVSEYQRYVNRQMDTVDEIPIQEDGDDGEMEEMAHVNKYYLDDKSYQNNCGYCSLALDMRRRGYDVEAIYDDVGVSADYLEKYYDNVKTEYTSLTYKDLLENGKIGPGWKEVLDRGRRGEVAGYDYTMDESVMAECQDIYANKIAEELESQGPGARGEISVVWYGGGGHSMAYEVDKNGMLTIYDAQANTTYTIDQLADHVDPFNSGAAAIVRLDTATPNDNVAKVLATDTRSDELVELDPFNDANTVYTYTAYNPINNEEIKYNQHYWANNDLYEPAEADAQTAFVKRD